MRAVIRRALALALVGLLVFAAAAAAAQRLSYARAKPAIQAKADKLAGTSTRITSMYRLGDTRYSGRAEWERVNPTGCTGCGYDPVTGTFFDEPSTESCSVGVAAKLLASGRIRVSTEEFACY